MNILHVHHTCFPDTQPGDHQHAMQQPAGARALSRRHEQMFTGQQMGTQYSRLYQRLVSA